MASCSAAFSASPLNRERDGEWSQNLPGMRHRIPGALFFEQSGSEELPVAASGGVGLAATAPPANLSSHSIELDQWIIGTEVPPGLCRSSGNFASRDASDTVRAISVCYPGLGLATVLPTERLLTLTRMVPEIFVNTSLTAP